MKKKPKLNHAPNFKFIADNFELKAQNIFLLNQMFLMKRIFLNYSFLNNNYYYFGDFAISAISKLFGAANWKIGARKI